MADGMAPRPTLPPLSTTTRMFARSLGWSPERLLASFRPATVEDLPALLAFRQRKGWDDAAYLRWRYGLDAAVDPSPGQMWLLRTEEQVLAVIGSEAQRIHYSGESYDGQVLMDIQLLPELEGGGGGVWLNQTMLTRADVTLAVGANTHSIGLVKRLFSPLPPRRYCVLPLDSAAMLRQRGVGGLFARMGAPVLDTGWSLAHRTAQRGRSAGIEINEVSRVPAEDIEILRSGLSPQLACVAPSPEHLRWRLFDNPRARYRLLVAHCRQACVGYVAVRNIASDGNSQAGLHVLDWKVSAEMANATLVALLQSIIQLARAERCSKVFTTVLDEQAMPVLKRLGFLVKTSPLLVAGVHAALPLPGNGGQGHWQITDSSFDSDGTY